MSDITSTQHSVVGLSKSALLKELLVNAAIFAALCAFFCLVFSLHWQGAIYGATFGMLFGAISFYLTRLLTRYLGDIFADILIYGFAGTASGALAGGLTKIICTPIAQLVLDAIYGNTIGEPERAFYAVVYAGFLGGFFGLVQVLFLSGAQAVKQSEGKPLVIKEELVENTPPAQPSSQQPSPPPLKPRYSIPKELTSESFFSEN